jgi:putative ABC transport system permease protein
MALLLAGVGMYGVIAYSMSQRVQEIGIRIALGAGRADVIRVAAGEGMATAAIGILVGLGAAFPLTRLTASLLYGVGAYDPLTFVVVCVTIVVVAMVASFVPAYRAMRVNPPATVSQVSFVISQDAFVTRKRQARRPVPLKNSPSPRTAAITPEAAP